MTTRSHGLLDQVDQLIDHAKRLPSLLPAMEGSFTQSQLVRHGCVLTCAAIEQAIIESAEEYAGRIGDERLKQFLGEIIKTGRNPSPEYIKEVIGKLDRNWGAHIEEYIRDEVGVDVIKSIVSNRNRIAHGETVSMGVSSLVQWAPPARKLCLEINRLLSTATPLYGARARRARRARARR